MSTTTLSDAPGEAAPIQPRGSGLEVISIAKSYDKRAVLTDISLNVAKGEVLAMADALGNEMVAWACCSMACPRRCAAWARALTTWYDAWPLALTSKSSMYIRTWNGRVAGRRRGPGRYRR